MSRTARGTFDIEMKPGSPELQGTVSRFDFSKSFRGDLEAAGAGVMLSCGDPGAGAAGYVAIETVYGRLGDRQGGFALQQLGMMRGGSQTLHYEVVPGSGDGELRGITGTFHLTVEDAGTHRYDLEYDLEEPRPHSTSTSFGGRVAGAAASIDGTGVLPGDEPPGVAAGPAAGLSGRGRTAGPR